MNKVLNWAKNNFVFIIVVLVAIISCFFVPIDKEYLNYFSNAGETLTCVFSILIIVVALENIDFFQKVARMLVKKFKNSRSIIMALILITYISALINANDMALLTFLPLTYLVLKYTNKTKYLAFTFVMQNVASNLGGMISPIGNPQNIYLFSYYNISLLEFLKIMAIPTVTALLLTILICLFVKKEPLEYTDEYNQKIDLKKLILYIVLFILTLLVVCGIVPYYIALPIIILTMLIIDRKAFIKVDYTIVLTFVCFFIFSGNIARIPTVNNLMTKFASNTFLCSYLSCQLISNLPTAILLSKFTNNYQALLVSINIASLGIIFTSISGIISLKSFMKYNKENKKGVWYYIGLDFLINMGMLLILYPISYFSLMLW